MIFISSRVVEIPALEGKSFSMECTCSDAVSIISNGFFLYVTEVTVDLVLPLSVLIFSWGLARVHLPPAYVEFMVLYLLLSF